MTARSLLKQWFGSKKKPNQNQFSELIDSLFHRSEDKLPISSVDGLPDVLGGKADAGVVDGIYDMANKALSQLADLNLTTVLNQKAVEQPADFKIDGIGEASRFVAKNEQGLIVNQPDNDTTRYAESTFYNDLGKWLSAGISGSSYVGLVGANRGYVLSHGTIPLVLMASGGEVRIAAATDADNAQLIVKETGIKATKELTVYNDAVPNDVNSNATLIVQSVNRNANIIARVKAATGAGGFRVQRGDGSDLLQISVDQSLTWPKSQIITAGVTNLIFNSDNDGGVLVQNKLGVGGASKFSGSLNEFFGQVVTSLALAGTVPGVYKPAHSTSVNVTAVGNGTQPLGAVGYQINVSDQDGVTAATAPYMSGINIAMQPKVSRVNSPVDDGTCVNLKNTSLNLSSLTEFIYIGANALHKAAGVKEARAGLNIDANVDVAFGYSGSGIYGIDFYNAPAYIATFSGSAIRLGNTHWISARNAAGTQDVKMMRVNNADALELLNGAATLSAVGTLTAPVIQGGSASAVALWLRSTSHATKGKVYFGTSPLLTYFDEADNTVHINNVAGDVTSRFSVQESVGATSGSKTISRFYNSEGSSIILTTDYAAGAVTALRIQATMSRPLKLGTTSSNDTIVCNNDATTDFAGPIKLKSYTVATLPAGVQGHRAQVTDAVTPTFLGTVTGGGSVVTPVFHNGTAWVAG